jgi:hypothetical protein
MLDIEATGIDWHKESLLSIGILECDWDGIFWQPGRGLELLAHTERKPESEFAKRHLTELYSRCNDTRLPWPKELREPLLDFIKGCGVQGAEEVFFMGWNVSNFDIPFLIHKEILIPSSYDTCSRGKDHLVGDFHYRIYEMSGVIQFTCDYLKVDRDTLIKKAHEIKTPPFLGNYPVGKQHDALWDCYDQLKKLNGLLEMCSSLR